MLPFHLVPGIPVTQRAPESHDITLFHIMQMGGDKSHLVDRKGHETLFRWRGCDADGDLSLSGNG